MQHFTHCVYVMSVNDCIKIGVAKDPDSRLNAIQTGIPWDIRLEAAWDVPAGMEFKLERRAHKLLAAYRMRGEWFRCGLEEVAKHEPHLFRMAFGDAFKSGLHAEASEADRYLHGIMGQGRWMTLKERENYRRLVAAEQWPEMQREINRHVTEAAERNSEAARSARHQARLQRMFPSLP